MRKKSLVLSVLLFALFAFSGTAYPWSSTGGDGTSYGTVQETAVFENESGATISAGMIVLHDTTGTAESTLGAGITTTSTADSSGIVGVAKLDCADDTSCVVVTKGPIDTYVLDAGSDFIGTGAMVSTGGTTGFGYSAHGVAAGTKSILGRALEDGDGTDTGKAYIWVDPQ